MFPTVICGDFHLLLWQYDYFYKFIIFKSFYQPSRYTKHFDPSAHEYFYRDERTHKAQWTKPSSLGNYDVDMEDAWMLIRDSKNEGE